GIRDATVTGVKTCALPISRCHLIQSRHVPQQRYAGSVEIDADVVDTRLNDGIERIFEPPVMDVVLIEADADVLRINLHQFARWRSEERRVGKECSGGEWWW